MRRATLLGTGAMCAVLTIACGNTPRSSQASGDTQRPQPVDVRGCLTASGDQFVLTELEDASAVAKPTTETFQLTKTASKPIDLKQYVGTEVEVTGEADPARVAEVREGDAAAPAGTTGRVSTTEDARFANRKLAVSSITPTGNRCSASSSASQAPAR